MIPIKFGDRIERRIDPADENEFFTFDANAGDRVRILMSEIGSIDFEPEIRLYNPDGTLASSTWHYKNARFNEFKLTQDGTYTIIAGDRGADESGDYALNLQRLNNPVNAIPINFGDRIENTINFDNEWNVYSFDANAGDRVRVLMSELVLFPYIFEPEINLYNPDGTLAGSTYHWYTARLDSFELTQDGTYTIIAGDSGVNETGDYALYLQQLNNPENAIPINFGDRIENTINFNYEWDTYTFDANAGDLVRILMNEIGSDFSVFEPQIRLYNPDGTLAGSTQGRDNAALDGFELTQDGIYTIIAGDLDADDTGDYALNLQRLNNPTNDNPPVFINNIDDITVAQNEHDISIDLNFFFNNSDRDYIAFSVQNNSNSQLVTPVLNGSDLNLDFQDNQSGFANITIRATANGKTVDDTFTVNVDTGDVNTSGFDTQLYRFQNSTVPGTYLFATEIDFQQNFNSSQFVNEGIAFYAYSPDSGLGTAIFRFENGGLPGTYLFVGPEEKQNILDDFPKFMDHGLVFGVET